MAIIQIEAEWQMEADGESMAHPQLEQHGANNLAGATTVPCFDAEATRRARQVVPLSRSSSRRFKASPSRAPLFFVSNPKALALTLTLALVGGIGIGTRLNPSQSQEAAAMPDVIWQPSPAAMPPIVYQPSLPPAVTPQRKAMRVEDDAGKQQVKQSDKGFKQGVKKLGKGALKVLKWPVKMK